MPVFEVREELIFPSKVLIVGPEISISPTFFDVKFYMVVIFKGASWECFNLICRYICSILRCVLCIAFATLALRYDVPSSADLGYRTIAKFPFYVSSVALPCC